MIRKIEISGVYIIKCSKNGKVYVGGSNNIPIRIKKHHYDLINNIHANPILQKEFSLYGEEYFKSEILEIVREEVLVEREVFYIEKYGSNNTNCGYNIQTPRKYSNINALSNSEIRVVDIEVNYGSCVYKLSLSGDFIEKFKSFKHAGKSTDDANIGKVLRKERKHSKGFLWVYEEDYMNGNYEVFQEKEYVFKEGKSPVCQFTEDGEFIQTWESITCATKAISPKNFKSLLNGISGVCSGKGQTASGYRWKYLKDCDILS